MGDQKFISNNMQKTYRGTLDCGKVKLLYLTTQALPGVVL
jgi:hypothetical protein